MERWMCHHDPITYTKLLRQYHLSTMTASFASAGPVTLASPAGSTIDLEVVAAMEIEYRPVVSGPHLSSPVQIKHAQTMNNMVFFKVTKSDPAVTRLLCGRCHQSERPLSKVGACLCDSSFCHEWLCACQSNQIVRCHRGVCAWQYVRCRGRLP